ncbi:family 43 glycosylhydrolase [Gaetbulibacter saemankumensis]|uniref:family 43 glycosylhydrolase n=1 Tax=Gaetbulibacter saemankumensis TaxID=311208 RepID=UPI000408384D|nr:family 43 glycosylhydrolase [Gaetbulibacter saemankumensis]
MKIYIILGVLLLGLSCDNAKKNDNLESTVLNTKTSKRNFTTYCNPIDIDYSYMSHYRAKNKVSYRSGADPAVINFNGRYYMFVTRSHGYWASDDMLNWKFIKPQSWYFSGCNAPAAAVRNGKVLVYGDPSGRGPILETDNPELGDWQTNYAVLNPPGGIQDPDIFVNDDNRVYLYEESSNRWPIHGVELDPDNYYVPIGEQVDLFNLEPEKNGWERFGQDHKSDLDPYIEGPWMMKHGDTYYLEYGAPGTQWNVYADGVYTSKSPLGPFEYAPYNPISYKPGGFLKGSGHGSTVKDNHGNYWHYSTMAISVNFKFERRIGMYPAGFEENGQMYVNTAYGDYPHYLPDTEVDLHKERFTGWMLLSYNKLVTTNSPLVEKDINVVDESEKGYMLDQITDFGIDKINDEEIRSYWVSAVNDDTIDVTMDLEKKMNVKAIQINFQDFNSDIYGRPDHLKQQFTIEVSVDGENWKTIADYSKNTRDMPHGYIELYESVDARYVRYNHVYCTNKYLAISEFRVFGNGYEAVPDSPANFKVVRQKDRRNADLTWDNDDKAQGYVIYWGIEKDKLNLSALMYDEPNYELRALTTDQSYYMQVESFNENGISEKSEIIFVE